MAEPILSVRNLRTYFRQDEGVVRAVDGASFDLQPGTTLGIVGESGCGKSVTARSILRIVERPGRVESGEIWLNRRLADGREERVDLVKLDGESREMRDIRGGEIGLVFQEPMTSFSAFHTVGNQMIEAIRLHMPLSKKEARKRAIELLRMVGIPRPERRIDEYSFELSGGLRQRVMIAVALAADPRILIADEPTTALDVTTQAQILELIRRLQEEQGLAVILITHDMGVIAEMADEVVVMYLGREVEKGPVDTIFHDPKHPYTRLLLRSIPSILATPALAPADHRRARSRTPTTARGLPLPPALPERHPRHLRPRVPAGRAGRPAPGGELLPLHPGDGAGGVTASATILEVENLRKWFPIRRGLLRRTVGQVRAVDEVSFTIRKGETLSLVGESGCGKTTTSRCILRAVTPTAGCHPLPHRGGPAPRRGGHAQEGAAAAAAADADDLPGPVLLAQPAHDGHGHHRRAVARERDDARWRPAAAGCAS